MNDNNIDRHFARTAQARIADLETQLEAHAWKVSPAMAQAQIDRLNDANDQLALQVTALERDKARLDWLESHALAQHSHFVSISDLGRYYNGFPGSLRAAIDAAMSEANEPNNLPHA